jgi:hypothetical protein
MENGGGLSVDDTKGQVLRGDGRRMGVERLMPGLQNGDLRGVREAVLGIGRHGQLPPERGSHDQK